MAVAIRSVALALFMLVSGLVGWSFMSIPILPFVFVSVRLYRYLNDMTVPLWCKIFPAWFELLWGVKVEICGDQGMMESPSLMILNHRTRFDWLFLWSYLIKRGDMTHGKIVLKKGVKSIPVYGWGVQMAGFLFLSRDWSQDEQIMVDHLRYYKTTRYPLQLLLFPEGTDLSAKNKAKSQQYAEANHLPVYHQLLRPRTKGFVKMVRELADGNYLCSVVDITVAYAGSMPHNERDLAAGRWPSAIHFHVKRFAIEELPLHDEHLLEKWLKDRWDQKEQLLEQFYQRGRFASDYHSIPQDNSTGHMISVLLFWLIFDIIALYLMLTYWRIFILYFVVGTGVFLLLSRRYDGLDRMELLFE